MYITKGNYKLMVLNEPVMSHDIKFLIVTSLQIHRLMINRNVLKLCANAAVSFDYFSKTSTLQSQCQALMSKKL